MNKRSLLVYLCVAVGSVGVGAIRRCDDSSGHFRPDSEYARNLDKILSFIALNVTLEDGYINATTGQGSSKVYALALCRKGYDTKDCYNCLNDISQTIRKDCPNQTEAFAWDGDVPCFIRYSNHSIFSSLKLEPATIIYNTGDIMSNLAEFNDTWERLMVRTLGAATEDTSKLKYYASDQESLNNFVTIYTLMQCTPDISAADCNLCLRQSLRAYQSCCHGKQGGVVQRPSCVFRWDLYPFYGAFDNPPSVLPPNKNSTNEVQKGKEKNTSRTIIAVVASILAFLILVFCSLICLRIRNKNARGFQKYEDADELVTLDSLKFNIEIIRTATDNFSPTNALGRGGFGVVYKGTLSNGQEIAVKRLSKNSGLGDTEFKNEVLLVAKLQHRNLVRLLGFCIEKDERLLVYEFVPNSSLDHFLFDPIKHTQLDWETRYKIIGGIARGILYLHEDSRLRIIHRDLKAGNILLDEDMCPKIADFGLARLFGMNETQGSTNRIVGTYGYMAPEYAMHGRFSVKTDVFSFGVLVLEIISSRKNNSSLNGEEIENMLSYAWRSWRDGSEENFIDPTLSTSTSIKDIKKCINIGLLCVQEKVANRPTMASVVHMLNSELLTLPPLSRPALFTRGATTLVTSSSSGSRSELLPLSVNQASITELFPR